MFHQELARLKAPPMANGLGLLIVGPTLMDHGTEAHQWLQEVGQEILGLYSQLSPVSPYYPTEVDLRFAFLFSRAEAIFSGTS